MRTEQIKILLINLERRQTRLQYMARQLEEYNLPWEWVSAVDGLELRGDFIQTFNKTTNRPLSRGEIGCYLSHQKCWEIARKLSGIEYFWILEDDVELVAKAAVVDKELRKVNKHRGDWDLLYTSGSDSTEEFFQICDPKHIVGVQRFCGGGDLGNVARRVGPQLGAYSYILSARGLDHCQNGFETPLNPVDVQFAQISPPLKMFLLKESITRHTFDGFSDTRCE